MLRLNAVCWLSRFEILSNNFRFFFVKEIWVELIMLMIMNMIYSFDRIHVVLDSDVGFYSLLKMLKPIKFVFLLEIQIEKYFLLIRELFSILLIFRKRNLSIGMV
jgi:hypothetical protein